MREGCADGVGGCSGGHVRHAFGSEQDAGYSVKEAVLGKPLEDGILLNNDNAAAGATATFSLLLERDLQPALIKGKASSAARIIAVAKARPAEPCCEGPSSVILIGLVEVDHGSE